MIIIVCHVREASLVLEKELFNSSVAYLQHLTLERVCGLTIGELTWDRHKDKS